MKTFQESHLENVTPLSSIADFARQFKDLFENKKNDETNDRILLAQKKREAVISEFSELGIHVVEGLHDETESGRYSSQDLFEKDDGGKLIETLVRVSPSGCEQVSKVVEIAKKHKFAIMPIGAKTSALGVFEAHSKAKLHNMEGVIGIEFPMGSPIHTIQPPEYNPEQFEYITHEKLPMGVLKSKKFPEVFHQVVGHTSVTINQVNEFLSEVLSSSDYHFRIMADPTSKGEACLGGVVVTGAEGGNRVKAADDIVSCTIIDADAEVQNLTGNDAKNIVGLNGVAGVVTQAQFEVTAYPKNEFGMLIPLKGEGEKVWKNALKLQQILEKYCVAEGARMQIGKEDTEAGTIITGMEIMSSHDMRSSMKRSRFANEGSLTPIIENSELVLHITGNYFGSKADFFDLLLFEDLDECEEYFEDIFPLDSSELRSNVEVLRHQVPSFAREEARELGGATQSTDLNIRFTSEDPKESETARLQVSKIYSEYVEQFKNGPFHINMYGHLHPGTGIGGGFDPHIRITLRLSDPQSRYTAPEEVLKMKELQSDLYKKLLSLQGKNGIQMCCPEKSRITNSTYLEWLRIHYPEFVEENEEFVKKYGVSRENVPVMAFRLPFDISSLRKPTGIKKHFNPDLIQPDTVGDSIVSKYFQAILELSQLSHRRPEIKKLLSEVNYTICDSFNLTPHQYPFFIESVEEGKDIIERNLGKDHSYKVEIISNVTLETLSQLECTDPHTFYIVDTRSLGVPGGLSLLITPHDAIKKTYKRNQSGENLTAFRNLVSMWKRFPYETDETPNIPAIAALGVLLQQKNIEDQELGPIMNRIITANPGPAQINKEVFKHGYLSHLNSEIQKQYIERIRKYLGIAGDSSVLFQTSATQMMYVLADALSQNEEQVQIMQVVNGAFSQRLNKVLQSKCKDVTTLNTPWTTGEHTEMEQLIDFMIENIDRTKKNILFITPHKTSTTANVNPNKIINELTKRGFQHGVDYELVCDVTSGAGGIEYRHPSSDQVEFSMFGSVQKALACPPGLSFCTLSPYLQDLLKESRDTGFGLQSSLQKAQEGNIVNPLGLSLLGSRVETELLEGRTPESIQEATREKLDMILGFLESHQDLHTVIPNSINQSPLLLGIYSQTKNLSVAKRLLSEIFGYFVGSGYGPFSKESIRLYLPNIAKEELQNLLLALHQVLQMPEVTDSVNSHSPNICLREPHDPISLLKRLSEDLEPNSIFEDKLGLHWLERVIKTYNANVENTAQVSINGHTPEITADFKNKALLYKDTDNLSEMFKILHLEDTDRISILKYYEQYLECEDDLKNVLMDEHVENRSSKADLLLDKMKFFLRKIVLLLETYTQKAKRMDDGKIEWPIVA